MAKRGLKIEIYCPSGEPRGLRIAEITRAIIQAVVVPRSCLQEAVARTELAGAGLYFLLGESEPGVLPPAYVGEAEECAERLKQHHKGKEFWSVAVALVSRTGSLHEGPRKLLEWMSIEKAIGAGRYQLENATAGSRPQLPESIRSDVADMFETTEVLLGTLGFPIFEPVGGDAADAKEVFYCKRGGAQAKGVFNNNGFVVLQGSLARVEPSLSTHDTIEPRREALLGSGVLSPTKGGYRFERDWAFPTPSAAAQIVCGGAANGWTEWKNDQGQTLDDVYRKGTKA